MATVSSSSAAAPVPAIIMIQNSETEGANYLGYFRQVLPRLAPNLHVVHYKMFNAEHLELLPTCMKATTTWAFPPSSSAAPYPFFCKRSDDHERLPPTVVQPCRPTDAAEDKKPFTVVGAMCFGGPMGAYDDDKHPFILKVMQTLRSIVDENVPYLGICLGAQMLARAFGGRCFKHTTAEFAFVNERVDAVASYETKDSANKAKSEGIFDWFKGRSELVTFQAHMDTFTLPGEDDTSPNTSEVGDVFVRVASGEFCTNQAFQVKGKRILGVQWHPDVDLPKARHWMSLVGSFLTATPETKAPPGVMTFGEVTASLDDYEAGKPDTLLHQTQRLADDTFDEWLVGVYECASSRSIGKL